MRQVVELMSVHFQHVVEYTTSGHGTRHAKAIGGIGPLSCPCTLLNVQLINCPHPVCTCELKGEIDPAGWTKHVIE